MDLLALALKGAGVEVGLLTTEVDSVDDSLYPNSWLIRTSRPGRYSLRWWRATSRDGPWAKWAPHLLIGIGDAAGSFALSSRRSIPLAVQCHGTTIAEARSAFRSPGITSVLRGLLNLARTPSRLRFLRRATEIWAVGSAVADQLAASPYNLHAPQVLLFPNGVDRDKASFDPDARARIRSQLGVSEKSRLAVFAGRLVHQKGLDAVISAMGAAGESSPRLVVVGDGPERGQLERQARAEGIANLVHFVGQVVPARVRDYLSAADLLVFPTRRIEGLPMILLEAAACGLPILTTPDAQVPDAVASHVSYIDLNDAAQLSEALQVFDRPEQRASYLPPSNNESAFRAQYVDAVHRLTAGSR